MARIVVLAEVRDNRGNSKRWRGLVEERMPYGSILNLACQKEPHEAEFPGDRFTQFTIVKTFGEHEYDKAAADKAWEEYLRKKIVHTVRAGRIYP
jgi:hypothetical protein